MTSFDKNSIESVLFGKEDSAIQNEFNLRYKNELNSFVSKIESAFEKWDELDKILTTSKKETDAIISALLYATIHSHVVSMKLFICGLLVPSGNTQRYALESMSLALLLSRPSLGITKQFMENKYSTNKSVRDVAKHYKALNLNRDALKPIENAMKHYNKFSHPSLLSLAGIMTVNSDKPRIIFGGEYDENKEYIYTKEINSKISLASIFPELISIVSNNFKTKT